MARQTLVPHRPEHCDSFSGKIWIKRRASMRTVIDVTEPERGFDESHAMGLDAAMSLSATLKALADPLRLRMLSAITTDPRGETCVCDLAELSDVSQPTVSHHLKVLKETGLL